jgi:asparagine synthase (glutamine-hydrolysing)
MPGIVGLLTKLPREWAEPQLLRMVEAIRHEPFYQTGTWVDESLGVYVGWAARKNSFCDGMPLCNERGDVVLVFSGEEYPEPWGVRRLKERGHTVAADGPSYLVHLYEEDSTFPACLNGQFHGLLTDRNRGTTSLFNDRYGMQRIYYHEAKEAFYFAAEAKAILAVRPELRKVDPRGLGEFVACGCVLENRTIFQAIQVLPPASLWVFAKGALEQKSKYFDPSEWENQGALEPEAYYQQLREVFSKNLPRYFNGRERVGMSLTGGLDTRAIMAWHKPPPGSLACYTFGGIFRDCQDVILARRVARVCGQPHEVIRLGQDFLSRFPHYAERTVYLTEACVDVGFSPVLYVNQQARQIAPVRMTGNYGDQILHRLRAFKPVTPAPGLFSPELLSYVRAGHETYARMLQTHPLSFIAFRQVPCHHYGLRALEQTQLSLRSPYIDNDLVRTTFRAPGAAVQDSRFRLRLIGDGNPALRRIRTDFGFGGIGERFPGAVRRRFYLFTFKAEYAYDHGMPQWIARVDHLFAPFHLERLFLGRHKYYHFRVWYRDVLSNYIREMLLDARTLSRPYLERSGLESIVHGHLKGDRNYTREIHKVLTLELAHRLFLDPR